MTAKMQHQTSGTDATAEKTNKASVAVGVSLAADRAFGDAITLKQCLEIQNILFKNIFPKHGFAIRKEQMALAEHIFHGIKRHHVSLAEAEVGTGKTLAYLVPAILIKRGRLNDFWNMSLYRGLPYTQMAHIPIVVATSSIALQKAIVTDYIPELSNTLLEYGIIKTPLTAVIRKGREHYVCEHNLWAHIPFEHDKNMKQILESLKKPRAPIDLSEIDGLSTHAKQKIAVPDRCHPNCPHREDCAYLRFRERVQSPRIDIQVCNHNYLLADALRRRDKKHPLLPDYQALIIDEAHKFLQAARSMYGTELSSKTCPGIKDVIYELNFKQDEIKKQARKAAKKLSDESMRLFRKLTESEGTDEGGERFTVVIDAGTLQHIRNMQAISDRLIKLLQEKATAGKSSAQKERILWELEQVMEQAETLSHYKKCICWLETIAGESCLCAIPKDLDRQLFQDLWSKGVSTVLTSGTLSEGGDFSHSKRTLGLAYVGSRLKETSSLSPFDHHKNTLLYLSEHVPFPTGCSQKYIMSVADEVEKLIHAAHGHAAVLFTSYKTMDIVWERLHKHGMSFPLFRLNRGGIREIERFKQSGNGVLFASGALWEGIDIPGDTLSLLVIVKLPFAVPDPIGEYEQTLYEDMEEYKTDVIVPEMLIKLKQGFGRLIRKESDTGVVAILDSRAGKGGAYRERVLDTLPACRITCNLSDVGDFMRKQKAPDYFKC